MGLQVRLLPNDKMSYGFCALGSLTILPFPAPQCLIFSSVVLMWCQLTYNGYHNVLASGRWKDGARAAGIMMGMCSQTSWHRVLGPWA